MAEAAPQPGERALDIGCGRGAATALLAEAVGDAGTVTAIDLSQRMVEHTRAQSCRRPTCASTTPPPRTSPTAPSTSRRRRW